MNRPDNLPGRSTIQSWTPKYSGISVKRVYSAVVQIKTTEPEPSEGTAAPTVEAEIVDEASTDEENPGSEQEKQVPKTTKQVIMNNYGKGVQIEELNGTLTININ